jgi:hypothetical protein
MIHDVTGKVLAVIEHVVQIVIALVQRLIEVLLTLAVGGPVLHAWLLAGGGDPLPLPGLLSGQLRGPVETGLLAGTLGWKLRRPPRSQSRLLARHCLTRSTETSLLAGTL